MQKVVGSNPITRSCFRSALNGTQPRFRPGIGAFLVSEPSLQLIHIPGYLRHSWVKIGKRAGRVTTRPGRTLQARGSVTQGGEVGAEWFAIPPACLGPAGNDPVATMSTPQSCRSVCALRHRSSRSGKEVADVPGREVRENENNIQLTDGECCNTGPVLFNTYFFCLR